MAWSVGMVSLGCTKNRVDSEQILGVLTCHGYTLVPDPQKADIIIVNTCGFIQPAKEESIDTILEMAAYKQTGQCKLLVVTGCLAQRYEKALMADMPEIDLLLGVSQYDQLLAGIDAALKGQRKTYCASSDDVWEHERVLTTPNYTAYTRIGDGCDNRCAYCAIPLIRGRYRSRPMDHVLSEIKTLSQRGVKEHILVAQDTTRYGTDWQKNSLLPELMLKAADIPGVNWLRVLYCYPDQTDERLLDAMASHPNICRYLDLPIQHISADLLKAMNRRGTPAKIKHILNAARKLGFALRTSIIVGFPGETEDHFKELLDFIEAQPFNWLGAFAFSPEEDTLAAQMPGQIPQEVAQERLDRLMKRQAAISLNLNRQRVGQSYQVLVAGQNDRGYIGRSPWEAPETDGTIYFTSDKPLSIGEFTTVRITLANVYDIMGVVQ